VTEHRERDKHHTRPDDYTHLLADFRLWADYVLAQLDSKLAEFAEGQQRTDRTSTTVAEELPPSSGCNWCPVCALAAAIRGEQHELLAVLAGHVPTLLALLRAFVDEILGALNGEQGSRPEADPDGVQPTPDDPSPNCSASAFVPIDVTIRR
jgi:hypothetical protein